MLVAVVSASSPGREPRTVKDVLLERHLGTLDQMFLAGVPQTVMSVTFIL